MRTSSAINEIRAAEFADAAALLARAYRDNPLTLALIGGDHDLRFRINAEIFGTRIRVMQPPALVAHLDGDLAGVCGFDQPGGSLMSSDDRRAVGAAIASAGPQAIERTVEMLAAWERLAPRDPCWHLGPVGVDPAAQGKGIGTAMVERFCAMMDNIEGTAYLETDLEANVHLYQRFGFTTLGVEPVIGVQTWLMLRRPC